MEIEIRSAERTDLAGLHALHDELHQLHVAAAPWMFRMPQPHTWTDAQLLEMIETPNGLLLVAVVDGEIAGLVDAELRRVSDRLDMNPHPYAFVDGLVVGEKWQRQGVGRALMDAVHDWARKQGLDSVMLEVWRFNNGGVAFYEDLGYMVTEQRMRIALSDSGEQTAS